MFQTTNQIGFVLELRRKKGGFMINKVPILLICKTWITNMRDIMTRKEKDRWLDTSHVGKLTVEKVQRCPPCPH